MQNIAQCLHDVGLDVTIVDNHSGYPPLLDWYKTCPYNVLMMDGNYGHTVFWSQHLYKSVKGERYILTDPDLDISDVPSDFVSLLSKGLDNYSNFYKCGLSLKIDDLPNTPEGDEVKGWESQFWKHKLDEEFYAADIDTTLAMYREGVVYHTLNAIRTAPPYSAKHIPWYYISFEELPEDEKFYYASSKTITGWAKHIKVK